MIQDTYEGRNPKIFKSHRDLAEYQLIWLLLGASHAKYRDLITTVRDLGIGKLQTIKSKAINGGFQLQGILIK